MRYAGIAVGDYFFVKIVSDTDSFIHHEEHKGHKERKIRTRPFSLMNPLTRPDFLRVLRILCG